MDNLKNIRSININKELEDAVKELNVERVKALLSAGANAKHCIYDSLQNFSNTLLHTTESVEIATELLLSGADVNAKNVYRETPLYVAITRERELEFVRVLLKHGADVNAQCRFGNTPLNFAMKKNYIDLEVVKDLIKYGAGIHIKYWDCVSHASSLHNAIWKLECVKLMVKFTLIRKFNKDYKQAIDLTPYSPRKELLDYFDDCVCEILQMKTDEIKQTLSLYELVTNNTRIHKLYGNQLSVRIAKTDYSTRYPIYNDIIIDKLKSFFDRVDLLNKLSNVQFYSNLDKSDQDAKEKRIILDCNSMYHVTEYLSNDSLSNLVLALDHSNKHSFQSLSSSGNLEESGVKLDESFTSNNTKSARLE